MKITFCTSQPHAPCSSFYSEAFKSVDNITLYDQNFIEYDVALFMTYDHGIIKNVKKAFPHLKIGLIDPRNYKVFESTKYCDFIIIDSIEMEDFWRVSQKPIFRYSEYPNIPYVTKQHVYKENISIGYHGNQIHLECMAENVSPALSKLGKKYNIELLIMHNGSAPTGNEYWYPKNVQVSHVPWNMNNYVEELAKCDIGIVPNNLLHDNKVKNTNKKNYNFNYSPDDYSLRFKMPSNPGRFIVFGKLGIPVVADFYPSAIQYLQNGNGFVAHHPAGWYFSLERLITSHTLRQKMGNSLQKLVKENFDFSLQNKNFILFLESIFKGN